MHIDRKHLRQFREKKTAIGRKPDSREEERQGLTMALQSDYV